MTIQETEKWIHVEVHVPTRERLDNCIGLERELSKKKISFDTGMAVYKSKPTVWRDWELDWSFNAPPRTTRARVLKMLEKHGFEYRTKKVEKLKEVN